MEPRRTARRPHATTRRIRIAALMLPAVLAVGACGARYSSPDDAPQRTAASTVDSSPGSSPEPGPDRTPPPDPRPEPVPSSSEPSTSVTGEVPMDLLDEIIADAAERLAVAVADVEVRRAESVTWPDGSLGCPEPGIVYTQALVPGYWVVLEADEQQLDYRVGQRGSFLLCENTTSPVPPGAGSDRTG